MNMARTYVERNSTLDSVTMRLSSQSPVVCAACATWMYNVVSVKVKICVSTLETSMLV